MVRTFSSKLPKQLLFSELTKICPRHGPKRHWKDLAVMDIRALGNEGDWYKIAQDRKQWLNRSVHPIMKGGSVLLTDPP